MTTNEISNIFVDGEHETIFGDLTLTDSVNNQCNFMKYPGSNKPDLKKLDEFIGVDTTKNAY